MSRFYIEDTMIVRVQKMLLQGLSWEQIQERTGFKKDALKKFIKKHNLKGKQA
jgi:hypothetical protein